MKLQPFEILFSLWDPIFSWNNFIFNKLFMELSMDNKGKVMDDYSITSPWYALVNAFYIALFVVTKSDFGPCFTNSMLDTISKSLAFIFCLKFFVNWLRYFSILDGPRKQYLFDSIFRWIELVLLIKPKKYYISSIMRAI